MVDFNSLIDEREKIKKIKKTGIFWALTDEQRESVRHVEKKNRVGEVSKGRYKVIFDEIIQDNLGGKGK